MFDRLDRWLYKKIYYSGPAMLRREFIHNAIFLMTLRKGVLAVSWYWLEREADTGGSLVWLAGFLFVASAVFFIFSLAGLLRRRLLVFTDAYVPQALMTVAAVVYVWFCSEYIAYDPLHALLQAAVLAVFALLPERAIPDASQKTDSRETLET